MNDLNNIAKETFASYLAKHYVGRKGFSLGTVPEAAALVEACDIVLTLSDGMRLEVICIVDRETHPEKTFGLSREELDQIGRKCLKYAGNVSGTQLPVSFEVMEVGLEPATEEDRRRLGALKKESLFAKVILRAWKLDTTTGAAWTNAPFGFVARRTMERLLRNPRATDADLQQPEIPQARERFPLLTIGLLVILAAVFGCELIFGVEPWSEALAPSLRTLVALGGLNKTLVLQSGEWYRIFSSTLLHGDLFHLALNGLSLYLVGTVLEGLVGRRWFFTLFVIGGACGSLMSMALNPESVVSVGASGAIMGLLAAAFVCSFRYHPTVRTPVQMMILQILIPSLLPIAVSSTGEQIDFAGHFGGALSGAIVGLALLKTWNPATPRPAFLPLATSLCVVGTLAFALSFLPVVRGYSTYTLETHLIPAEQIPQSNTEASTKAADLVQRYPRDPRARLYQANALLDRNDLAGAERELRIGLAEREILTTQFNPELEAHMNGLLALVLNDRNQPAEAKAVAQPACSMTNEALPIRERLIELQLCEK